jgi:hypothetical protein
MPVGNWIGGSVFCLFLAVVSWMGRDRPFPGEGWPFQPWTGDLRRQIYLGFTGVFSICGLAAIVTGIVAAIRG